MLGDRLAHEHQLTKESADYTRHVLLSLAVTINIHYLLQDDALLNFGLPNELTVDVRLQFCQLLSTLCRLFVSTSLGFSLNSCQLLLLR